jgi:hypothetical protein
VLVALEYLIVLIVDFAILAAGGAADAGGLSVNIFDTTAIFSGSLTAAILFCLGSSSGSRPPRSMPKRPAIPKDDPPRDLSVDPDDRPLLRLHHMADDRRDVGGRKTSIP